MKSKTYLYSLPKDILIKLISHIQEDSKEIIQKQAEKIHLLEFSLECGDCDSDKCSECDSMKVYHYNHSLDKIETRFIGRDIPGLCIICEKTKCLDHLQGECDACVMCHKCKDLVKWEDGHIIDLSGVVLSDDIFDQIAWADSKCKFYKSFNGNF